MPYQKSQARKSFDLEIDKMISVIKVTFANKLTIQDTREHVLSSCVMLCSAKLEVYFEDFFDAWVQKINNLGLTSSHLPNNLKAVFLNQVFLNNAFRKLITENSESQYIDALTNQLANPIFNLTDHVKVIPQLTASKIYQNKKYPSPDNVKLLFKRIGIINIFNELNRSSKSNMEIVLQSFNDFRSAIAHNGIPTGINNRDVIDKLNDIKKLIYHLDKTLFKHVNKHTTSATWTT